MNIFIPIVTFLFGIMIGWACFWITRRVEKITTKFATFLISVLAGGIIIHFGGVEKIAYWLHILGIFLGWVLWLIIAKKAGAPADIFYSQTRGDDHNDAFSQSKSNKHKYY